MARWHDVWVGSGPIPYVDVPLARLELESLFAHDELGAQAQVWVDHTLGGRFQRDGDEPEVARPANFFVGRE